MKIYNSHSQLVLSISLFFQNNNNFDQSDLFLSKKHNIDWEALFSVSSEVSDDWLPFSCEVYNLQSVQAAHSYYFRNFWNGNILTKINFPFYSKNCFTCNANMSSSLLKPISELKSILWHHKKFLKFARNHLFRFQITDRRNKCQIHSENFVLIVVI